MKKTTHYSYLLCVMVVILCNFSVRNTYVQSSLISKSISTTTIIGESIEFDCAEYIETHQYNTSIIKWLKDGNPISIAENYNRMVLKNRNQILQIAKIGFQDEGTYECDASNQVQHDYSMYTLNAVDDSFGNSIKIIFHNNYSNTIEKSVCFTNTLSWDVLRTCGGTHILGGFVEF